ncbi:MAG: ATP-dependent helicase C-terminal domain-containing protein, partial [Pseudomonadota bacterium]
EPTGLASAVNTFLARVRCLHDVFGEPWPTWTQKSLQASVETWLAPILSTNRFEVPSDGTIAHALKAQFDWQLASDFDQYAPIALELPSGRRAKVDWLDERAPLIECRAQDLYGASQHLSVAAGRVPVTLQILSPGGKPVATTRDLPAFWRTGYHDMAKDMRGRYPKHDWPEDPVQARPHPGLTKARLAQT